MQELLEGYTMHFTNTIVMAYEPEESDIISIVVNNTRVNRLQKQDADLSNAKLIYFAHQARNRTHY